MILGIGEFAQCGQNDAYQVKCCDEGEEFAVCVEPQVSQDPSTDLGFYGCWLWHDGLEFGGIAGSSSHWERK